MNQLSINSADWERLKIKLKRKYRDLTDSDLSYTLGSEQQLIEQLAKRIKRDTTYVTFTIQKELSQSKLNSESKLI